MYTDVKEFEFLLDTTIKYDYVKRLLVANTSSSVQTKLTAEKLEQKRNVCIESQTMNEENL
jgi:hypothetical protein